MSSIKHTFRRSLVLAAIGLAGAGSALAGTAGGCATTSNGFTPDRVVYGLTQAQALVSFHTCTPGKEHKLGAIAGLQGADSELVGIDFRVQDGLLYGVGNGGGVYTIDLHSAVATKASQLTTALSGTHFGVNFNPAANALRIVSDNGQNLRHPFINPEPRTTLVDPSLNYVAGTAASGVAAIAYTNNDLDATTGTFLFDIDAALDQLVIQAPANNGSLVVAGKLGIDIDAAVGFDIYSHLADGKALTNTAFASFSVAGAPGFYRINLLTGRPVSLGALAEPLLGFSVALDQ